MENISYLYKQSATRGINFKKNSNTLIEDDNIPSSINSSTTTFKGFDIKNVTNPNIGTYSKGTAYDILEKNIMEGGIIMENLLRREYIDKIYDIFIKIDYCIMSILLFLVAINPQFFPRIYSFLGIIIIIIGQIGLYIDKVQWRKKNDGRK